MVPLFPVRAHVALQSALLASALDWRRRPIALASSRERWISVPILRHYCPSDITGRAFWPTQPPVFERTFHPVSREWSRGEITRRIRDTVVDGVNVPIVRASKAMQNRAVKRVNDMVVPITNKFDSERGGFDYRIW